MSTKHGEVKAGDSLVLIQGAIILQVIANEDKYIGIGDAMFDVKIVRAVNFVRGISRITINLNYWYVFQGDSHELTSRLIDMMTAGK